VKDFVHTSNTSPWSLLLSLPAGASHAETREISHSRTVLVSPESTNLPPVLQVIAFVVNITNFGSQGAPLKSSVCRWPSAIDRASAVGFIDLEASAMGFIEVLSAMAFMGYVRSNDFEGSGGAGLDR
jgi:hypothetical protein